MRAKENDVPPGVVRRARAVRFILMDVDGVLTDGRLYVSQDGTEWKTFHTHDGHGIRLGQRCGLGFGILSGRESRVVARRAEELRITEVHQRVFDKGALLGPILARIGLSGDAVCYIGDDLVDLPVMRRVGLAVAPADARPEVIEAAHYVTARRGGRGAVREAIELVLRARGEWDKLAAGNP